MYLGGFEAAVRCVWYDAAVEWLFSEAQTWVVLVFLY